MNSTYANAGLCASCRHAREIRSRRSAFLRCGLADVDTRFPRYPRLPVLECTGYRSLGPRRDPEEAVPDPEAE